MLNLLKLIKLGLLYLFYLFQFKRIHLVTTTETWDISPEAVRQLRANLTHVSFSVSINGGRYRIGVKIEDIEDIITVPYDNDLDGGAYR